MALSGIDAGFLSCHLFPPSIALYFAVKASQAAPEQLKLDDQADRALLLQMRQSSASGTSAAGRPFFAPSTVQTLADCLLAHPQAMLLAGSTEIGLQVNKQFARPEQIVYLGNVAELRQVEDQGRFWRIGAQVSLSEVLTLVSDDYPDFAEVLRRFGSPPIRSTATLAGNIANGSPIGDSMPCLLALGATLELRRGDVTRMLDLEQFYTGQKKTALQSSEFIVAVHLPKLASGQVFRAHKVSKRFDQDISATCCAMRYEFQDGRLAQVRLAYNGLAPSPCRAPKLEAVINGRRPEEVTAAELDQAVAQSFTARDGLRASWTYRALLARNLVLQFVEEATAQEAVK